jgi:SAM-dependent methyltransferase
MLNEVNRIKEMHYADFVGFLGQDNTPPGGRNTILKWIELGQINSQSHILDLACSTGYSSRLASLNAGCKASGIDISKTAIENANLKAKFQGIEESVRYSVGDASDIPFSDSSFTHIFAGCTFGFIQNREKALDECMRVLEKGGLLAIANFYYDQMPPERLLDEVQCAVGFRPSAQWTRDWWNSFFGSKGKLLKEEDCSLPVSSDDGLSEVLKKYVFNDCEAIAGKDEAVKQACFEKLLGIRRVLNEHRKYQRFNITLWKKV